MFAKQARLFTQRDVLQSYFRDDLCPPVLGRDLQPFFDKQILRAQTIVKLDRDVPLVEMQRDSLGSPSDSGDFQGAEWPRSVASETYRRLRERRLFFCQSLPRRECFPFGPWQVGPTPAGVVAAALDRLPIRRPQRPHIRRDKSHRQTAAPPVRGIGSRPVQQQIGVQRHLPRPHGE